MHDSDSDDRVNEPDPKKDAKRPYERPRIVEEVPVRTFLQSTCPEPGVDSAS